MDVRNLVSNFADTFLAAHPDFDFLGPRGQLTVNSDHQLVRRIRVDLPGTTFLHLHSVQVHGRDEPLPMSDATWSISSTADSFSAPEDPRALFDPNGDHKAAFQTRQENEPWLEIVLPEATDVDRIVLRNSALMTFGRAAGLRVSVCDDGPWRTIYDGQSRVRNFRQLCEFMLDSFPSADDLTRKLTDVLVDVSLGKVAVRADFAAIEPLSYAERGEFRAAVSESILARRELEWTSHGIRRSFRYWSGPERERYLEYALGVIRDLTALTDKVCFGFGAALAIVRQGDLIPHDDDLDIIVGLEPDQAATLADGIELIRRTLGARGYSVTGPFLAHQHVRDARGLIIDVFVGIFEGDRIDWFPGPRGALTRSMMFPTSVGSMLGRECPLPRNPLPYLEKVYGSGWRVPSASFTHSWRRDAYGDIAGERPGRAGSGG